MISSAFELLAFWTGIVAVGITATGALFGCLSWWFSSRVNFLKEEISVQQDTTTNAPTEAISHLQRSADRTGNTAVTFAAAGALFGCLSWWFSFTVSDTKEEARVRFESEYAAKMKVAESDVVKARQETANALAHVAVANERTGNLEVEAAGLRERAARAEDSMNAAEARSEDAKKEVARAHKSTAKALADVAAANERTGKFEVEAAGLRERAARAEIDLMKVKERIERRAISDAQRTRLQQALKRIPKGPIKIIAVLGDEDAGKFAKEMADILKDAGWIDVHMSRGLFSGGIDGFEIRIRDREKVPVSALQMARAFDSIGFEPALVLDPSVAEGAMEIIIGMEPDAG
ncbi:MAG: hypothetical protein OEV99_03850 [Nitrospira sp.]|nr:hypothetical protein [Nitrospira sp.]MDH4368954.1 hypothetical protein [Nitrospira sp.]MDH5496569.1 hypothetical protein [Nitrospira sp.]MDH5725896.1 hypothetical protein [Nitrospira sp.]